MASDIEFRAEVNITIFPRAIDEFIDNPSGRVSVVTKGLARNLLNAAKPLIGPKGYSGTTGKPRESRKGRLRDAGSVIHRGGSDWAVQFDHPIAFIHHEGASSHAYNGTKLYANRNANTWTNSPFSDGHFALKGPFTHPGHKANRFLVNAARSLGLTVQSPSSRGRTTIGASAGKGFF